MLDSMPVSETSTPLPGVELTRMRPTARLSWAILIAATLAVCYFSHLGAIGFVGPDEPRYAWISRAMTETGDWVTPRLYGKPWFEKPPLLYWGVAVCFKLFGASEAAARMPSAICALLATLAMGWLAWRMYGGETARWLLLLLPTTAGMIGFSHAAATDMPFSGMLTIAMVCAAAVVGLVPVAAGGASPSPTAAGAASAIEPGPPTATHSSATRTGWLALALFGLFLGLAVLAKGPAAIILSGGAVFFWALFTKRWHHAFRLLHPAAIITFCVTALPWYILCALRNPDFFHIFIIEHNFKRYLTPEFQHIQPLWFYIPALLAALLPWVIPLLWTFFSGARLLFPRSRLSGATCFFLCWAGFCLLFFTISRSKLPGYILPAVPATGFLMVHDLRRRLREGAVGVRWISLGIAFTLVLLGTTIALESDRIPLATDVRPATAIVRFYLLMIFVGLLVATFSTLRLMRLALLTAAMAVPIALLAGTAGLSQLGAGVSARSAAWTAQSSFPQQWLSTACTYKLRRAPAFALNFYLRKELPECRPPGDQSALIFTAPANVSELEQKGISCLPYRVPPVVAICADEIRATSIRISAGSGQPQ